MLEVSNWASISKSWSGYGHLSLIHPYSKICLSIFILKVQRTSMYFKSWFEALKEDRGSSLGSGTLTRFGYGHWCLIHPWSNFGFLSWFWRWKEHPGPLSPDWGLWWGLEVPYWCLISLSWFGYGHWCLIHSWSEFGLSIFILRAQNTSRYVSFVWSHNWPSCLDAKFIHYLKHKQYKF